MERKYLDCRDTQGWLTDDLECQIDTEPWCDYHYYLAVRQAILHAEDNKLHSEWKHIVLCVLFCVPTLHLCTMVYLIVDRLLGG